MIFDKANLLLFQLPVPQLGYRKQTGNVPLAAAYLKIVLMDYKNVNVEIIPESLISYCGDKYLINYLINKKPDVIGVTLYCWNLLRTKYIIKKLKESIDVKVIAGGPEVSKDNYLLIDNPFDELVYGEGEDVIGKYFKNYSLNNYQKCFISPYLSNLLEPEIEACMFIETQRGCPYKCSFCNYNKAMNKVTVYPLDAVLPAIQYAYDSEVIKQVYLMDPSLNTRPDLVKLVTELININNDKKLQFFSEIRAESIDKRLANLFGKAGFAEFEIGLQSINQKALRLINRLSEKSSFFEDFVYSCKCLQDNEIVPKIDLIIGLPGDDYDGFRKSVDFVKDNGIDDSVQVFALSLLPDTELRKKANIYEINWQELPPYYIKNSPSFDRNTIINCFKYAEKAFDIRFDPMPVPDLAYKNFIKNSQDLYTKILFYSKSINNLEDISKKLSMPYQLWFFYDSIDPLFIKKVVKYFTDHNPFTSVEIVLYQPKDLRICKFLSNYSEQFYPGFIDNDLYYIDTEENRKSFLVTAISDKIIPYKKTSSYRQFFLWNKDKLPDYSYLQKYQNLDGIFIDSVASTKIVLDWQLGYQMFSDVEDNYFSEDKLAFADEVAQKNWLKLFFSDQFYLKKDHSVFVVN